MAAMMSARTAFIEGGVQILVLDMCLAGENARTCSLR